MKNEIIYLISVLEKIANDNRTAFNECSENELKTNHEFAKFYKKIWLSNLRLDDSIKMIKLFYDQSHTNLS